MLITFFVLFSFLTAQAVEPGSAKTDEPRNEQEEQTRFKDKGDGTVLDRNSGLMWLKEAYYAERLLSWEGSAKYIQKMNKGEQPNFGYKNWRVPTTHDFDTLIDKTKFYPALPDEHPFENVQNYFYWTSSRGTDIIDYIWIVDVASGDSIYDYVSHCNYRHLWPVRSAWDRQGSKAGIVLARGLNDHGQLGNGTTGDRGNLLPVKDLSGVIKIAAGMEHAAAVISDGTLWTWGRNREGQLGIGTFGDSLVPKLVKGLWGVVDVAAGMYHTVALKADGTVWAWGRNTYGQLGNGTLRDSMAPVKVLGVKDMVAVSAGMYHTIAIDRGGELWIWGRNTYGQLGDGATGDRDMPVKVDGLSNITRSSAGLHHTVALRADGTVWAWGWNMKGMLGDGTKEVRHTPVQVKGLSDVVDVSAGLHHTVALKSDGSAWAWGANEYKQLGSSARESSSVPLMVEGISDISKISASTHHSVALMSNGTVWVWGKDMKGRVEKPLPVKLRYVRGVIDISAGKYFTLALESKE